MGMLRTIKVITYVKKGGKLLKRAREHTREIVN